MTAKIRDSHYNTKAWHKARADHLARYPICQLCHGNPSDRVDHVITRAQGGTDNPYNLRSVCASCHSKKTAMLDGGFGNAPFDLEHLRKPQAAALRVVDLDVMTVVRVWNRGWRFKARVSQLRGGIGYHVKRAVVFCQRPDGTDAAIFPAAVGGSRRRSVVQVGNEWQETFDGGWTDCKRQQSRALMLAANLNSIGEAVAYAEKVTAEVGCLP